jgi:hypothetical protein
MKSGIEIWIGYQKAEKVMDYLKQQKTGFGMIEDRLVNLVEIEGIFCPVDLDDLKRTKLGQRKCKYGNWHNKDENCECGRNMQPLPTYTDILNEKTPEEKQKAMEAIEKVREELRNKNIIK